MFSNEVLNEKSLIRPRDAACDASRRWSTSDASTPPPSSSSSWSVVAITQRTNESKSSDTATKTAPSENANLLTLSTDNINMLAIVLETQRAAEADGKPKLNQSKESIFKNQTLRCLCCDTTVLIIWLASRNRKPFFSWKDVLINKVVRLLLMRKEMHCGKCRIQHFLAKVWQQKYKISN